MATKLDNSDAKAFNLAFDLSPTDGMVEYVKNVHETLTSLVNRIAAAKKSGNKASGVETAVAYVTETDTETVSEVESLSLDIRKLIFSAVEKNPSISILLPSILGEIRGEVSDVRNLTIPNLSIPSGENEDEENEDDEAQFEEDLSEMVELANIARAILIERASTLLSMEDATFDDLPESMVKKSKDGSTVLALPQTQKAENEDGERKAGKPLATSSWSFKLNGQELPKGVNLQTLAVLYCSTTTGRVNAADIASSFYARTGFKFPDGNDKAVKLTVPAGELLLTPVKGK